MQGAALKTTASYPLSFSLSLSLTPSLFLSLFLFLSSPSRRGDKTSRCTEADPYTADPAADALLPTYTLVVAQPASNSPDPHHPPRHALAMAEGTTPSRETLPSRKVLGWCELGRWVVWVGTGGLKGAETVFHSVLLY